MWTSCNEVGIKACLPKTISRLLLVMQSSLSCLATTKNVLDGTNARPLKLCRRRLAARLLMVSPSFPRKHLDIAYQRSFVKSLSEPIRNVSRSAPNNSKKLTTSIHAGSNQPNPINISEDPRCASIQNPPKSKTIDFYLRRTELGVRNLKISKN